MSELFDFDFIAVLLPFFFVGVVLVIAFAATYFSRKATETAWRRLADRTGLGYESGRFFFTPQWVSGSYRGRSLTLDTFTRGSGRNRTTYTRVVAAVPNPQEASLALMEEGFLSAIGKTFGAQDVQLGDAAFDQRFVVKSDPAEFAADVLDSFQLRQQLLGVQRLNLRLKGPALRFEQRGVERNADRLQAVFDAMAELAAAIEGSDRATDEPWASDDWGSEFERPPVSTAPASWDSLSASDPDAKRRVLLIVALAVGAAISLVCLGLLIYTLTVAS